MGRIAGLTAEQTRERVTEAAAEVFAECGYEGTRVSQIAARAGLSTGAMYNHFASKAELLAAVVERYATNELHELLLGPEGPPADALDLVHRRGASLQQRPRAASLLAEAILAARRDDELGTVLVGDVVAREAALADLVRFAQQAGEVTDDVDPAVVARFCLMLGLGSLLVRAMELEATDEGAWSSFISRLIDGFRTTHAVGRDTRKDFR